MLKISDLKQLGVYSKIVRTDNGLVRVHFAVVEVGGRIRGRVISVEPIIELEGVKSLKSKVRSQKFLIANSNANKKTHTEVRWYERPIISPYITLDFFYSQPTRAPSGNL